MGGDHIALAAGDLRAELWPAVGGSLGAFFTESGGGRLDFVRPASVASVAREGPLAMGSFPLVPYSGRIRDGRFTFAGRDIALPLNFPPAHHSIHGHGWQAPWSVAEANAGRAVLDYRHAADAWPFAYRSRQIVTLSPDRLTMRIELTNEGSQPMPAGIGHHPYFPRTPHCRLSATVDAMWETDDEVMPTRLTQADPRLASGLPVAEVALDNVFPGWRRTATIDWPDNGTRLALSADTPLDFLVVYSPPAQDYFCVEPVSHCTDAFNLAAHGRGDTGMLTLAPGAIVGATVRFRPTVASQ